MATQQLFEFDDTDPARSGDRSGRMSMSLEGLQSTSVLNSGPPRTLETATLSEVVVKGLRNRLHLGDSVAAHVISRVLVARGITSAYQKRVQLDGSLAGLPDPSCALNFDRATDAILSGIHAGARFGVVGDYDVDGITAVAQWNETAAEAGIDSHYWIPNRFKDGYGTSPRIAAELLTAGVHIAIFFDHTPAPAIVERLRSQRIECIVFDHHSLTSELDAIVVNPNQPGCGLGQHAPSASGLSFLLSTRIRERLHLPPPSCALVAAGTIADMVPLDRRTNRIFVAAGLPEIAKGTNIGLLQLLRRTGRCASEVTCDTVAFTIAPRLNAAGRMDDARRCVELLTSTNGAKAFEYSGELERFNEDRQARQAELVRISDRRVRLMDPVPPVIVLMDANHHGGTNGLVAQSIASKWARPTVILSQSSNDNDILVGSARNGFPKYDLTKLWEDVVCEAPSGMVIKAGGHPAAAGISIHRSFVADFSTILCASFRRRYGETLTHVPVVADCEIKAKQLTARFLQTIDQQLAPYGQGFPAPRFLFRDLTVTSIREWNSGLGYSVVFEQGKSRLLGLIGLPEYESNLQPGTHVDVVASATTELYQGEYRPQLSILGYQVVAHPRGAHIGNTGHTLLFDSDMPPPGCGSDNFTTVKFRGTSAEKPAPIPRATRPSNNERLQVLLRQLQAVRRNFDGRWLYPDLEAQIEDPLAPKDPAFWVQCWDNAVKELGIALDTTQLEYRPAVTEFVRYATQFGGNQILCAPTGSGKTAIALTLGSIFHSHNRRLVFLAPTVEIVQQTATAAERLLGSAVTVLTGDATDTTTRSSIYRNASPKIICATPHVLKNDLAAGVFSFTERDLLIDDEAHHEEGNYPSVAVVDAARKANATILLLSATPGQVEAEGLWSKLEKLKARVGVDCIFPLNVRPNYPRIASQHTTPSLPMQSAQQQLLVALSSIRDHVLTFFAENELDELHRDTTRVFGGKIVTLPPRNVVNGLLESVRALSHEQRWEIHSKLQAAAELRDLIDVLTHQGIGMFLMRCIERRFEVFLPRKKLGRSDWLAAPQHLRTVYSDRHVSKAYRTLAQGRAIKFLSESDFREYAGEKAARWKELSQRERTALFNQTVRRVKEEVLSDLATHEYCNHPHEEVLLREIKQHGLKTLISVPTRDYAFFLGARLQHLFSETSMRVVVITGAAQGTRKGTNAKQRQENLAAFNNGDARIAVATQVIDEGVDLRKVEQGYIIGFDGSQRRARQRQGRVGRHSFGRVTYLCASQRDYIKLFQIVKKEIAFEAMINNERKTILSKAGFQSIDGATSEVRSSKVPGPPAFDPDTAPPF